MNNIKTLRDKTGCGILDCKKALEEANDDIEKAVDILRKKGIAKAAKRADRDACEGIIIAGTNDGQTEGYMVEINSETDFVAKNEKFQEFAEQVYNVVREMKPKNVEELMNAGIDMAKLKDQSKSADFSPSTTVKDQLENLSGVIGEKLDISNVAVLSNSKGTIGNYVHAGGKIGVLVELSGSTGLSELAKDIAMQVAAANPKYVNPEDVPNEELEKEKDIYREQLKGEGKPENIINKIVEGKMNKFYEEVCLVKQVFIKDEKKKVEDVLKEANEDAKVEKFVRFAL